MVELGVPDVRKIARGVVYGTVLTALGRIFTPIFNAIEFALLGSQPGVFAGFDEQWGLADVPVAVADTLGDVLGAIITTMFGVVEGTVAALAIQTPGPWDGLVFTVLLVLLGVFVARVTPLLVSAIPVVGTPLASLLEDD